MARPYPPARDHRLPGLRDALLRGQLVGYRWGRRAVVDAGDTFVKVVRATKQEAMAARHRAVADALRGVCITPEVVAEGDRGWVELTRVPGRSLHQLLVDATGGPPPPAILEAIGRSVDAIHALHDADTALNLDSVELTPVSEWRAMLARPGLPVDAATDAALAVVPVPAAPGRVLVHGDLHDKNVFITGARVDGLIDFDSLALGPRELDVANLAAHLVLRGMQGGWGAATGARWALAALARYDQRATLDQALVGDLMRHTWMRLACIYRFRASSRALVPLLLALVTGPAPLAALEELASQPSLAGLRP